MLVNSPFALATAAKQGILVILKAIKEIKPGIPIPVASIIVTTSKIPSSVAIYPPAIQAARVPNVAITFSLAIKPVTAATTKIHPK